VLHVTLTNVVNDRAAAGTSRATRYVRPTFFVPVIPLRRRRLVLRDAAAYPACHVSGSVWALALAGVIAALLTPATVSVVPWLLHCGLTPVPGNFQFEVPSSLTINPALSVGAIAGTYYATAGVIQFRSTCATGFVASYTSHIFLSALLTKIGNGAMRIAGMNLRAWASGC